jgi:hypothetical protein
LENKSLKLKLKAAAAAAAAADTDNDNDNGSGSGDGIVAPNPQPTTTTTNEEGLTLLGLPIDASLYNDLQLYLEEKQDKTCEFDISFETTSKYTMIVVSNGKLSLR